MWYWLCKVIRSSSVRWVILLFLVVGNAACDKSGRRIGDYLDEDINYTREDYINKLIPPKEKEDKKEAEAPPIPDMADVLVVPKPEEIGNNKHISIAVTEDIPLKDVFMEIARLADVDLEIDQGITGGVIFKVQNRPLQEVIDRIAEMAGLRYYIKKGVLRIERDLPYIENYQVDFLNIVRSNTGSVTVNTQVLGGASGGEGASSEGLASGSNSEITTTYEGDLWASVESTLSNILLFSPSSISSAEGEAALTGETEGTGSSSFSINRQAGVVTALATKKQHHIISQYLAKLEQSVSAQVLIEAKVVEVTLNTNYQTGIDWDLLNLNRSAKKIAEFNFSDFSDTSANIVTINAIKDYGIGLTGLVRMIEQFGVTRTLSSPRLHAMNNQQAVLTFAENNVYFTLDVQREEQENDNGTTDTTVSVDSTLNTVPIGVVLTLQPSINLDTDEVTMNIRPTLSRITDTKADPGVDIVVGQVNAEIKERGGTAIAVTSNIPVIEVREMDTVMKIKSGELMVIGGLMEERSSNTDKGIPFLGRVPFFGNAFKSIKKANKVVETVILIKATIIPSSGGVRKEDQQFYKAFTRDPRPLKF